MPARTPPFELLAGHHSRPGFGPFGGQLVSNVHRRADPLEVMQSSHGFRRYPPITNKAPNAMRYQANTVKLCREM